jgi:uncharacterized membrane protein YhaH (DUF805 family)
MDRSGLRNQLRFIHDQPAHFRLPMRPSLCGPDNPWAITRAVYGSRICAFCAVRNCTLLEPAVIAHTNALQNVVLDIFVFVLPIPILAKLQMPRRKKIGVMAVFSFGAGSVIMSIIRHHSLLRIINIQTTSSGLGEVLIVVALEINLAAIAVNLPAIRSIWVKRSHDRKKEMLAGKYGGTTARSQTVDTLGPGRPRQMHEMSQLSNTARDSPLSDSQEELWRTIENADANVPCQHKKVSRHEQFTTVEF